MKSEVYEGRELTREENPYNTTLLNRMTKYGQTWWGAKWMNALSYIDYSNRLPRGLFTF